VQPSTHSTSPYAHEPGDAASLFHFARFTLDLERGELRRDEAAVTLRPCAFRVLAYLVQRAGRVVSRDELFDHIWSGVVVADGSLTQSVWEVRRALQGAGDAEDFIRTRRGSGYCFTAAVRRELAGGDAGFARAHAPACSGPSRDDLAEIARLLRTRAQLTSDHDALAGLVAAYDSLIAMTRRLSLTDLEIDARLARAECMLGKADSPRN
jgi:DNA-binding winged helix-turn-helix (wHTH) protein